MFITVIVIAWLHIHLCIWTTYRANHEKGTVFTQHISDNALSWQHSALITSSLYKDFYISYNLHSFPPRCVRLWIIKSARSVIGAGVFGRSLLFLWAPSSWHGRREPSAWRSSGDLWRVRHMTLPEHCNCTLPSTPKETSDWEKCKKGVINKTTTYGKQMNNPGTRGNLSPRHLLKCYIVLLPFK